VASSKPYSWIMVPATARMLRKAPRVCQAVVKAVGGAKRVRCGGRCPKKCETACGRCGRSERRKSGAGISSLDAASRVEVEEKLAECGTRAEGIGEPPRPRDGGACCCWWVGRGDCGAVNAIVIGYKRYGASVQMWAAGEVDVVAPRRIPRRYSPDP